MLEKTLESPSDCKEIQPVHPKGDQSWVFIGRTDVEAESPTLWPPHEKSWLIGKDPEAAKDWGQEEKGMMEDEMAGWHHRLSGHEFECTPGVGDGLGGLVCCKSWGCRVGHNWATGVNWWVIKIITVIYYSLLYIICFISLDSDSVHVDWSANFSLGYAQFGAQVGVAIICCSNTEKTVTETGLRDGFSYHLLKQKDSRIKSVFLESENIGLLLQYFNCVFEMQFSSALHTFLLKHTCDYQGTLIAWQKWDTFIYKVSLIKKSLN